VLQRFTGTSSHSLDDKGRINLPVKVREILTKHFDERLVVTLSARVTFNEVDRCLHLFPTQEFEKLLQHLETLPASNRAVAAYKRKVVSNAEEVQLDKQGRILLPPMLREQVGLQDKVMLVGSGNVLELWSAEAWTKAQDVNQILVEEQEQLTQFNL
jgi:MraZ protein